MQVLRRLGGAKPPQAPPRPANSAYARLRKCSNLIGEGKVFVEFKVESGVGIVREHSCSILESCCLSPIRRNSVLEELRVRRLAAIQEESETARS